MAAVSGEYSSRSYGSRYGPAPTPPQPQRTYTPPMDTSYRDTTISSHRLSPEPQVGPKYRDPYDPGNQRYGPQSGSSYHRDEGSRIQNGVYRVQDYDEQRRAPNQGPDGSYRDHQVTNQPQSSPYGPRKGDHYDYPSEYGTGRSSSGPGRQTIADPYDNRSLDRYYISPSQSQGYSQGGANTQSPSSTLRSDYNKSSQSQMYSRHSRDSHPDQLQQNWSDSDLQRYQTGGPYPQGVTQQTPPRSPSQQRVGQVPEPQVGRYSESRSPGPQPSPLPPPQLAEGWGDGMLPSAYPTVERLATPKGNNLYTVPNILSSIYWLHYHGAAWWLRHQLGCRRPGFDPCLCQIRH